MAAEMKKNDSGGCIKIAASARHENEIMAAAACSGIWRQLAEKHRKRLVAAATAA